MRLELEQIMAERAVEGRSRYKVYEDKIYRNSVIVKAAYNLRNNPDGLLPIESCPIFELEEKNGYLGRLSVATNFSDSAT